MGYYKSTITCAVTTAGRSTGHSANAQTDPVSLGLPTRHWDKEDKKELKRRFSEDIKGNAYGETTCTLKCGCGKILTKVTMGFQSPKKALQKLRNQMVLHICGEKAIG